MKVSFFFVQAVDVTALIMASKATSVAAVAGGMGTSADRRAKIWAGKDMEGMGTPPDEC